MSISRLALGVGEGEGNEREGGGGPKSTGNDDDDDGDVASAGGGGGSNGLPSGTANGTQMKAAAAAAAAPGTSTPLPAPAPAPERSELLEMQRLARSQAIGSSGRSVGGMWSVGGVPRRRRPRPSAGSVSSGSTFSGGESSGGAEAHARLLEPVSPQRGVAGGGDQSSDGGETLTDCSKCACMYLPPATLICAGTHVSVVLTR